MLAARRQHSSAAKKLGGPEIAGHCSAGDSRNAAAMGSNARMTSDEKSSAH
jgi:hypothetical protein